MIICVFIGISSFGQSSWCGFEPKNAITTASYMDKNFKREARDDIFGEHLEQGVMYTLPVVFHVLYSLEEEKVSISEIQDLIKSVNQNYSPRDVNQVRPEFKEVVGNPKIQMFLINEDLNHISFAGVNYIKTNVASFNTNPNLDELDKVKFTNHGGQDAWNPREYINIWVCNLTPQNDSCLNILGYAYPPHGDETWSQNLWYSDELQGVVLNVDIFNEKIMSIIKAGEICAHELGHYFGLHHIWGDVQMVPGMCEIDDFIDDTPISDSPSFNCSHSKNTCGKYENNDLPDMTENYMDIASGSCMKFFTHDQVERMRVNLISKRSKLVENYLLNTEFDSVSMYIFPNPLFRNTPLKIVARTNLRSSDIFLIEICDISGKLIFGSDYEITKGLNLYNIDLNLSAGTYLVRMYYINRSYQSKLIIL